MDLLHLDLCKADYVQSYPNTMLFCMRDLTIWHLFSVNWCWLDFYASIFDTIFSDSGSVCIVNGLLTFWISLMNSVHCAALLHVALLFSFFLFLPFHARCRTLLFLDDLTFNAILHYFCFFVASKFFDSLRVKLSRDSATVSLWIFYTSISQSSALDVSAKLLLVFL